MSTPNLDKIDALGQRLGHEALTTLVRLCPEVREAAPERLEAACAAMRAKVGEALDELLADAKDAPWLAHVAFCVFHGKLDTDSTASWTPVPGQAGHLK